MIQDLAYITKKFKDTHAVLKQAKFSINEFLPTLVAETECRVRILPSVQAATKAPYHLGHWIFDLRLKSVIQARCVGMSHVPKPKFDAYIANKEDFVDVLIERCAYLTAGCTDDERDRVPEAIDTFLKEAILYPKLDKMIRGYGQGVTSTIAIAANFWRFHVCGKPWLPHEKLKDHSCDHPAYVDDMQRCLLCMQVIPDEADQRSHIEAHSQNMQLLGGYLNF